MDHGDYISRAPKVSPASSCFSQREGRGEISPGKFQVPEKNFAEWLTRGSTCSQSVRRPPIAAQPSRRAARECDFHILARRAPPPHRRPRYSLSCPAARVEYSLASGFPVRRIASRFSSQDELAVLRPSFQ